MSAIAGAFSRRGAPRRPGEVDRMLSVMASRGPDGSHTWAHDTIALGHAALDATPESVGEVMPLVDPATGNVFVADVRLDNRAELIDDLKVSARDGESLGDGRLLLHAYREWGEDCVDHLLGDFAFAVWDERRQQLFLARDHFGAKPLTFHCSDQLFAFSSDSRCVVGLEGVPETINRDRVFDFLVDVTEWIDTTSTFFEHVQRLAPAHTLTVSATDRRFRRYWNLPEPEILRLGSDAEYEEATREVLDLAVRCRLRGRDDVGVMLSGGIDSSSVAATVRHYPPLRTFSAVSDRDDTTESDYIRATTAALSADATFVDPSRVNELCGEFSDVQRHRESLFSNGPLVRSVFSTARSGGCRSMVSGIFADEVVQISPTLAMRVFLADHQPWSVVSLAGSRGNLATWAGRFGLARSALSVALGRTRVFDQVVAGRRARQADERFRDHLGDGVVLVSGPERERLRCRVEAVFVRAAPGDTSWSTRHRMFDGGYTAAGLERYDRTAAACSLESRSPFTDRRVVEFFQSLPATQLVKDGWSKSVLRRSMEHVVPPQVVWNKTKPHLAPEFYEPWVGDRTTHYLRNLAENDPLSEYVDVDVLRRMASNDPLDAEGWQFRCLELGVWLAEHAQNH